MATKEKETPTGEKEQQGRGGGFIEAGNRAPVDTATATLPRMMNAEATDVDGN